MGNLAFACWYTVCVLIMQVTYFAFAPTNWVYGSIIVFFGIVAIVMGWIFYFKSKE